MSNVSKGQILAIDSTSVHRICSGQVVLTLADVIKELVENSLDAEATAIDVRTTEFGSELIEVSDNGSGVEEDNFIGLTLKHHTSKISNFDDVASVESFGFRGEALSSLCALSKLTIITRHKNSSSATKLEFDNNGTIVKKTLCSRQVGTTVTVHQLFASLPVRHKEFLRNVRRDFHRMVSLLTSYCIVAAGIRITCTNTVNGRRSLVLSTSGQLSIKDNILSVFGAKQVQQLVEVETCQPDDDICAEFGLTVNRLPSTTFRLSGYISSVESGCGRNAADRQFVFINGRPCDMPKIMRIVNDVYHQYNRHQYPCLVLIISTALDGVDVNVTPDKRKIFVEHEKLLFATVKASLLKLYDPSSRSLEYARLGQAWQRTEASVDDETVTVQDDCVTMQDENKLTLQDYSEVSSNENPDLVPSENSPTKMAAVLRKRFASSFANSRFPLSPPKQQPTLKQATLYSKRLKLDSAVSTVRFTDDGTPQLQLNDNRHADDRGCHTELIQVAPSVSDSGLDETLSSAEPNLQCTVTSDVNDNWHQCYKQHDASSIHATLTTTVQQLQPSQSGVAVATEIVDVPTIYRQPTMNDVSESTKRCLSANAVSHQCDSNSSVVTVDVAQSITRRSVTASFSLAALRDRLDQSKGIRRDCQGHGEGEGPSSFRARISPSDNQAAEEELRKELRKEQFKEMEVIGQFNMGFIIARLGNDLFIIDQHATDEKFNFETLMKTTVIQSQRLIQPLSLELTAANESLLIDKLSVFAYNGFDFVIDEQAPCMQRVKLTSVPMSRTWTFGKSDIDELLFMLADDAPDVLCRPSRVRSMFASRACRQSIMIGTALSRAQMMRLISHMADMEQPWNCPHGRPTIRHLINLMRVQF